MSKTQQLHDPGAIHLYLGREAYEKFGLRPVQEKRQKRNRSAEIEKVLKYWEHVSQAYVWFDSVIFNQ